MGQKVHPLGFRVGITKKHQSQWFARFHKQKYAQSVLEDRMLRHTLTKLFPQLLNPVLKVQKRDADATVENQPRITQIKIKRGLIPYEIGIQIHAENCEMIKASIENLKINRDLFCQFLKTRRYLQHLRHQLNVLPTIKSEKGKTTLLSSETVENNLNTENALTEEKVQGKSEKLPSSSGSQNEFKSENQRSIVKNSSADTRYNTRKQGRKYLTKQQLRRQFLVLKRLRKRQNIRLQKQQFYKGLFLSKKGSKVFQKITRLVSTQNTKQKLNIGNFLSKNSNIVKVVQTNALLKNSTVTRIAGQVETTKQNVSGANNKETTNLTRTSGTKTGTNFIKVPNKISGTVKLIRKTANRKTSLLQQDKVTSLFKTRIKKKFVSIFVNRMNKKFLQALKGALTTVPETYSFGTGSKNESRGSMILPSKVGMENLGVDSFIPKGLIINPTLGSNVQWNLKTQKHLSLKSYSKITKLISIIEQKSLKKMESLRKDYIAFGSSAAITKAESYSYYQMLSFLKQLKNHLFSLKRKQKLQYIYQKFNQKGQNLQLLGFGSDVKPSSRLPEAQRLQEDGLFPLSQNPERSNILEAPHQVGAGSLGVLQSGDRSLIRPPVLEENRAAQRAAKPLSMVTYQQNSFLTKGIGHNRLLQQSSLIKKSGVSLITKSVDSPSLAGGSMADPGHRGGQRAQKLKNIEKECQKLKFIEYLKALIKKHRTEHVYLYLTTIAEARKDLRKLKQFTKRHANFLFGLNLEKGRTPVNLFMDKLKDKVKTRVQNILTTTKISNGPTTLIDIFLEQIEKQRKMYIDNATLTPKLYIQFYSVKSNIVKAKAAIVADTIIDALEKRKAFRKVVKTAKEELMRTAGIKGVKIQLSGRLNGAEIARSEWVRAGRVPLQTLRANIDYSYKTANTIYGIIGIKVWIFKGYTVK
ncbi:MAG: 30S ribosomal protein S3 [Agrobacterium sp.]|uniref:Small ribosomal subunit protein uS3c n=1 Tax=Haematococcus lacustris TaxID=44745 RepID=A0A0S2ICY2_HAELA|nr:ribosomal protein S3 [Haematococcus lacustris]